MKENDKEQTFLKDENIFKFLQKSKKSPLPCILCGELTYKREIFQAPEKGILGAPKDVYKIIIYPLCNNCFLEIDYKEKVQKLIYKEYN